MPQTLFPANPALEKKSGGRGRHLFAAGIILLIALGLRLYGIGWGLPHEGNFISCKSDENTYLRSVSQMKPAQLDFNPHFFYWGSWHFYELGVALKFSQAVGLVRRGSEKGFYYKHTDQLRRVFLSGRFLSVAFALLTIWLVYAIGAAIQNPLQGLAAAAFLSVLPAHVINSHYLKSDASVTFWVTLLLYFGLQILRKGEWKHYLLAGLALGLAPGAQYNGVLFGHTILAAHLLKSSQRGLLDAKPWTAYLTAMAVGLLANPYYLLAYSEAKSYLVDMFTRGAISNVETSGFEPLRALGLFSVGMGTCAFALTLASFSQAFCKPRKENLLILFWMLPYMLYLLKSGMVATRFQMLVYPGLSLWIGGLFVKTWHWNASKAGAWARGAVLGFFGLAFLHACAYSLAYDRVLAAPAIQDEASLWMQKHVPEQTVVGFAGNRPYIEKVPSVIHQDFFYGESGFWRKNYIPSPIDWDLETLAAVNPPYFVIGQKDGFEDTAPSEAAGKDSHAPFLSELRRRYDIVASFGRDLSFFGLRFKPANITDWCLPFQKLYVLRKKDAPA